jgi:hypothetical protein
LAKYSREEKSCGVYLVEAHSLSEAFLEYDHYARATGRQGNVQSIRVLDIEDVIIPCGYCFLCDADQFYKINKYMRDKIGDMMLVEEVPGTAPAK